MSRERDSFNEINITPLTDIFLVLLIIMMVIAPLLDQQGLNLTVPDGEEITTENLEGAIKERIKDYPDGLLILASPDTTHGSVVKLMDISRNSGVKNISMSEGD